MAKRKVIDLDKATPAERLKYVRKLVRLSRPDVEEKYQLSAATLKAWENGQATLTAKGIKRCIDIYRKEGVILNREWIMTGEGLSPKLSLDISRYFASELQYPLRDNKGMIKDSDLLPYSKDDNACILREAAFFKESYPDAVILTVTNDDMEPVYQIGDYVGGRFRYGKDIATTLKRNCIVRLKTGEDIIRRIFKSNSGKYYNLACINPVCGSEKPILFNVDVECVAPVIWHRIPNN
jgi:transcriptional regulator with XRE-family HTH domain